MTSPPYPPLADFAATWGARSEDPVPPWAHRIEVPALPSLEALGLRDRLEAVLDTVVALQRSEWLQEGVYVGPRAMGHVYRDVLEAARVLGVAVPPTIVSASPGQGAFGTDARAWLHLSSGFLTAAGEAERAFVIGRLCGHLAARQVTWSTVYAMLVDQGGLRRLARQGLGPTLEIVLAPLSVGVRLALSRWHRAAEISADRAGLLVSGDLDACRLALLRSALGVNPPISPEQYLEQIRRLRPETQPGKWAEVLSSAPWLHKRMLALDLFAGSELFAAEASISREELDRRTADLLRVS